MAKLRVLVVVLVMIVTQGEEWFQPDSNLINEAEHASKIGDPSTFKFVKYFTPNCMYCRYLKMVVDKIKHEKEWCFTMYDFNCQWYPQFCFQSVRAAAFPHTVVYNPEGAVDEVISGFYPEPVMRTIFDRLEAKCLQHKASSGQPAQVENPPSSLTSHQEAQPEQPAEPEQPVQPNAQESQQNHEQAAPQPAAQTRQQPTQKPAQQPVAPSVEASVESHPQTIEKKGEAAEPASSTFNYIFYGACAIISAIYIHHVHNVQDSTSESHAASPEIPYTSQVKEEPKVEEKVELVQYRQEEKQMLASLSDDQL